jgi:hypothetical protein
VGGGGREGVRRVKVLLVKITCDLAVPATHHQIFFFFFFAGNVSEFNLQRAFSSFKED